MITRGSLLALSLLGACSPQVPEGQLVCADESECPPTWSCIEGLCYSRALDAGSQMDAGADAGRDAGELADAAADGGPTCTPASFPIRDLAESATDDLLLDFDALPGIAESAGRICLTFDTANPNSARHVLIGAVQQIGFGPCVAMGTEGPWTICHPYVKPRGMTSLRVDNSPLTAGCQVGAMTEATVEFPCP